MKLKFHIYRIKRTNYIGSTTNIKKRFGKHKFMCYNKKSVQYYSQLYKYIRANDLKIKPKIYATYKVNGSKKFNNKMRMLIEQYYIDKYNTINNGLNTNKAFISDKEKKEWQQKYYLNNKEKRDEYMRQYHLNHKEQSKIHKRKWYLNNHKEKVKCDKCGKLISRGGLPKHQSRKVCYNNISNNI